MMRNKMEEIRSFVKDNQKKLGIAFLSLLGLGMITTGVWYSQSLSKANDLDKITISKVKEVKEVKKEETSSKKEEVKETKEKDKVKAEDKKAKSQDKKEETRSEEKGSTVVIESEAKKDTTQEAKEKKQTKVETKEDNKPGKESAVTKVTPTKKEETKPVKTNTTQTQQAVTQPSKPAETKPVTPAPKREEIKKDPNEGKVWREAEYRTIQVPAVTEKRWIVDETAWTEQVMVGSQIRASNGSIFSTLDEYYNWKDTLSDEDYVRISYSTEPVYEDVYHEEKGHWEDVVITPATTRQELVREAGWY